VQVVRAAGVSSTEADLRWQLLAALRTAALKNATTTCGRWACPEAVATLTDKTAWLIGTFHGRRLRNRAWRHNLRTYLAKSVIGTQIEPSLSRCATHADQSE